MHEISRVKYADSWIPESWVYTGGDKDKMVPIILSVFLVKTNEKLILVDAGCEYMNSLPTANLESPVKVLQSMGVKPEDITDVVITHAHHDHIACDTFASAVFGCGSAPYRSCWNMPIFPHSSGLRLSVVSKCTAIPSE